MIHPEYSFENGIARNNICLIRVPKLSEQAPEDCEDCFRQVCLPPKLNDVSDFANVLSGQYCWIGGWGSVSKQTTKTFLSNKLRDAGLNIFRFDIIQKS